MQDYLSKNEIDALEYIHRGDYRVVGKSRRSLDREVANLKTKGLVTTKYGPSDCSRIVLTRTGICVLAGLS